MARMTTFPAETILSVDEGSVVYRGVATAVRYDRHDVLMVAINLDELKAVVNEQFPGERFNPDVCHKVVIVARKNATLDDEL